MPNADASEQPISAGPHYEIHSTELAAWLLAQGPDVWWSAYPDPRLGGQISMPASAEDIAPILVRLNRLLLVRARDPEARGQRIDAAKVGELTEQRGARSNGQGPRPLWANNRILILAWKDRDTPWELVEDLLTTLVFKDPQAAALVED